MANHGHCKNCWWYKQIKNTYICEGICYMQSRNIGVKGAEVYHYTNDDSYCPDYLNRKQGEKIDGKLDEWILKQYK